MKEILPFIGLILLTINTLAQEKAKESRVKVSGFANYSLFYDTRQNIAAVDGLFVLYPKPENRVNGFDLNDNPSFTMLALGSRIGATFAGPDVLGARTSGKIEADFTLVSEASTIRFRHAYVQLKWTKTSLLAGRTWHPLFTAACFPTTLGIATGAPYQPFSRTPQIRFNYTYNNMDFMLAAISQMDYSSTGPNGKSPEYMRNAVTPELALQAKFNSEGFLMGIIGDVKTIQPRTTTTGINGVFHATEKLTTYSIKVFSKYQNDKFEAKAAVLYGQNMYEVLLNGGYGVATYDSLTGRETYTSLSGLYSWVNLIYGRKLKFGIMAGWYKNYGAGEALYRSDFIWARGADIDQLFRITPVLTYEIKSLQLGLEYEWNQADYGSLNLTDGKVTNTKEIVGQRITFDIKFFF